MQCNQTLYIPEKIRYDQNIKYFLHVSCIRKSWNLRNILIHTECVWKFMCEYVCVFQRYTYNLSIQFGNVDRKIKLYNAACPLPRRQLSDPTGNSCWFFAPNDYWLCQHPYHLLHCYCILGFSFSHRGYYFRQILHDFNQVWGM